MPPLRGWLELLPSACARTSLCSCSSAKAHDVCPERSRRKKVTVAGSRSDLLLLNVDHAFLGAGLDLIHPPDYLAGKFVERFGVRRIFAFEHCRLAGISGFADIGIELDVSQKRHAELAGSLLRSAARKNINLVTAVRANEVAHVLHHAH